MRGLVPLRPRSTSVRFPLKVKLAVFAGILVVVNILAIGWAALERTSNTVMVAQQELQIAILEMITHDIEAEFGQAHDGLDAIARAVVDQTIDIESRLTMAKVLVESNEILDNAILYTEHGTQPEVIKEPLAAQIEPPDPLSRELVAQSSQYNIATGITTMTSGGPRVIVVMPILFEGRITGFAASLIPLTRLQARIEVTASAYFKDMPTPLLVVDANLRILARPNPPPDHILADASEEPIFAGIHPGHFRGRFSHSGQYKRADGSDAVGTIMIMESRPWALAAMVPTEIAYAPIIEMRRIILTTMFIAAVIAVMAATLLSRRITSPLDQLSQFATHIAQRDFSTRVNIRTRDELAIVGQAMSQAASDLQHSEKQIRQEIEIRSDLGRYLPAELVDKVVKREQDMRLGGGRLEITVLFADIVAFTPLTEQLPPEKVVQILNELFTIVTEIIFRHEGMVDKFIGDCVMAIWGAPTPHADHAAKALEAAEEIISWLEISNASWEKNYGVSIKIAIGVNSGEAIVGNIGSKSRMEYTAIGTTVNLAARLEAIARPQQILISERTAQLAGDGFRFTPIGERMIAGSTKPLTLYEVIS